MTRHPQYIRAGTSNWKGALGTNEQITRPGLSDMASETFERGVPQQSKGEQAVDPLELWGIQVKVSSLQRLEILPTSNRGKKLPFCVPGQPTNLLSVLEVGVCHTSKSKGEFL
jgi:hypothetical protein